MRGMERVSAAWRRITVDDPALWRRIGIDTGLSVFLQRTGGDAHRHGLRRRGV